MESEASAYLKSIAPEELERKFERKYTSATVTLTVEDALIDVFQEETPRYGEFIALPWQMRIEPPHLGWSRYQQESFLTAPVWDKVIKKSTVAARPGARGEKGIGTARQRFTKLSSVQGRSGS